MGYRFYPDKIKGEGFFATCMIKTSQNENKSLNKNKSRLDYLYQKEISIISSWVSNANDMLFFRQNNQVCMIHKFHESNLIEYQNRLYLKKAGTVIGRISGIELIPDHELALSNHISTEFAKVELKKEDALLYLKKQNFSILNADKGWQLMSYMNINLGWAKILQNRINNYYPTDWRILRDIKESE